MNVKMLIGGKAISLPMTGTVEITQAAVDFLASVNDDNADNNDVETAIDQFNKVVTQIFDVEYISDLFK